MHLLHGLAFQAYMYFVNNAFKKKNKYQFVLFLQFAEKLAYINIFLPTVLTKTLVENWRIIKGERIVSMKVESPTHLHYMYVFTRQFRVGDSCQHTISW